MSRPLRLQVPGGVYHVTSRGNRRAAIFVDDDDRRRLLDLLGRALQHFEALALAYCLMGNHYHLVVQTRSPNLSRVMHRVNSVYSRAFNRRHGLVGHLFESRFHAVLVDSDAYLTVLCRYVELNPVRARLVTDPDDWPWSSCRAHTGLVDGPHWLDSPTLHGHLLGRNAATPDDRAHARALYALHVKATDRVDNPFIQGLREQLYLGDARFAEQMRPARAPASDAAKGTRRHGRLPSPLPPALAPWAVAGRSTVEVIRCAHAHGGMTMRTLAAHLGVSASHVCRLIGEAQDALDDSASQTREPAMPDTKVNTRASKASDA